MMRRMRTRLPTYLSTGLGALVDICNTPWDYALNDEARRIMPQAPRPSNPARKSCSQILLGSVGRMQTI
jgi:hypothetical protein